jgi:hypothetical protein
MPLGTSWQTTIATQFASSSAISLESQHIPHFQRSFLSTFAFTTFRSFVPNVYESRFLGSHSQNRPRPNSLFVFDIKLPRSHGWHEVEACPPTSWQTGQPKIFSVSLIQLVFPIRLERGAPFHET